MSCVIHFLLCTLFSALIIACGNDGGGDGTPPTMGTSIGPNGGTVTSSDGLASVTIPSGALSEEIIITVDVATGAPSGNLGLAYEFSPNGLVFNKTVTIVISYADSILSSGSVELALRLGKVVNSHWEAVIGSATDPVENTVSGTTISYSIYGIIENSSPSANAGPDQSVSLGSTVQLDGTASIDADGDLLTFMWSLTSIPVGSLASLSGPTAIQPTFVVDLPGTYVAQLIVNDGTVDSEPDTVIVSTENLAPVANAGSDRIVSVGETVQLDGTASSDPEGDTMTFKWSLTSIPDGSTATLSNTTAIQPSFVADLEGSYVADLIVNDGQVDSLPDSVIIPAGLGTYSDQAIISTATITQAVAVGDFNGDGYLDLPVASSSQVDFTGAVSMLLGDGNGGFSGPTIFPAGDALPGGVAVGDFDNDGFLDVAVTNTGVVGAPGNTVTILLGDGSGGFSSPTSFTVAENPRPIAVGDFNNDQNLDIAAGHFPNFGGVSILLGDGTGGFSAPTNFDAGSGGTSSISVADFNSDQIPDLALGHNGMHNINILFGDGTGYFSPWKTIDAVNIGVAVVEDFNGDKFADLAATGGAIGGVLIRLGDGAGNFSSATEFETGQFPFSMIADDINGDQFLDFAATNPTGNDVSVLFGDGTGSFFGPFNFPVGNRPDSLAAGDFNGDGFPDLAVTNDYDVSILLWVH